MKLNLSTVSTKLSVPSRISDLTTTDQNFRSSFWLQSMPVFLMMLRTTLLSICLLVASTNEHLVIAFHLDECFTSRSTSVPLCSPKRRLSGHFWQYPSHCHSILASQPYSRSSSSLSSSCLTSCPTSNSPDHPGRVEDRDRWITLSSNSLQQQTGQSLLERMHVSSVAHVHSHERYAILSHGIQEDPIYNYFNAAALATFRYPETQVYQLASRYSAPPGNLRLARDAEIQSTTTQANVARFIPTAIRQDKDGKQFVLCDLILWNVYDEQGQRVGQTALFDREKIQPV